MEVLISNGFISLLRNIFEEGECLVLGLHMGEACYEAALLLDDLGLGAAFYGGVGIHDAYYSRALRGACFKSVIM